MGTYTKAFAAMLGAVAVAFITVVTDDIIEPIEVVNLALAGIGAFAVYVTPNLPGYGVAKAVVLAVTAGLEYVVSALETDADLTWPLWAQVIATGVAAVVAYLVPNTRSPAATSATEA